MKKHLHVFHLLLICAALALATDTSFADSTSVPASASLSAYSATNAVYLDVSTALFIGAISLNYEHTWGDIGFRVGFGAGGAASEIEVGDGYGGMAMLNVFPLDDHKLEFGFGASVMWVSRFGSRFASDPRRTQLYPAGAICYRVQPSDGGVFLRLGLSYVYYLGTPVTVSIGFAF